MVSCKKCNKDKDDSKFYKVKTNANGLSGTCISCTKKDNENRFHTKSGIVARIYNTQLATSRRRGHQLPAYTKNELYEWLMSQDKFHLIFNEWKSSGFKKDLKPSVDRLNDEDGYHFGNIQIETWDYNNKKGQRDIYSGKNKKRLKEIYQFDFDGNLIATYPSIAIAGRATGSNIGHIGQVAKGKNASCNGFIWRYTNGSMDI